PGAGPELGRRRRLPPRLPSGAARLPRAPAGGALRGLPETDGRQSAPLLRLQGGGGPRDHDRGADDRRVPLRALSRSLRSRPRAPAGLWSASSRRYAPRTRYRLLQEDRVRSHDAISRGAERSPWGGTVRWAAA